MTLTLVGACSLGSVAWGDSVGSRLIGRWLIAPSGATATYAGSTVVLHFEHSERVSADFTVSESKADQDVYLSVEVDGGKPVRVALSRGAHLGVVLASELSLGPHRIIVRKEGEPGFGALQFAHPALDVAGRWLAITDDRPIIEVIGDSDATGICVLGPDSPVDAVSIWHSAWAAESLSWVGLLERGLAAVGHPADVVDLAISGSKAASEADSYDYTAPRYSNAQFTGYAAPGRTHAAVVLLWGGGNDRHGGGDMASSTPPRHDTLSAFQLGIYDQLTKIFARNPDVQAVLLEYTDPLVPPWKPAYDQVLSLLSPDERKRVSYLRVYDPKGRQEACEVDPKGHPNLYLHAAWAGQILRWMTTGAELQQLGFPDGEQWDEQ